MNLDLEQSAPLRRRGLREGNDAMSMIPPPPPGLAARHPLQLMKRTAIIGGTLYAMQTINLFHNIIHSPEVKHEWFKAGLACSVLIMAIKAYVELHQGKMKKQQVEYENFRTATHITIVLILIAWISFHKSLSPLYGGFKTMLIMIGFGFGVLLQAALMIPVVWQNFLSVVILTFFLQQYK